MVSSSLTSRKRALSRMTLLTIGVLMWFFSGVHAPMGAQYGFFLLRFFVCLPISSRRQSARHRLSHHCHASDKKRVLSATAGSLIFIGLRIAQQDQIASVGGRQMDIKHLQSREFFPRPPSVSAPMLAHEAVASR